MLGAGIIKGMFETARNFVGSYRNGERLVTVQYPEQRLAQKENTRNFPMLIFDGADPMAGLRCVACKICEQECPPQCIYIEIERDARGKPLKHPKVFDIDLSVCMSCQICVEVCPFESIKMNTEFEFSPENRFADLLVDKHALAKSNEYYHKLHPTEAGEVDARLSRGKKPVAPPPTARPAEPAKSEPARPALASRAAEREKEKAALAA